MNLETETREQTDIESARSRLAGAAERAFEHASGSGLLRVSVPVSCVDPFRWLAVQEPGTRAFWSGRESKRMAAMAGVADVFEGSDKADFDRMSRYLETSLAGADEAIRYFGGIRFDDGRQSAPEWSGFGAFRFVLPRFELILQGGRADLVCNIVSHRDRASVRALLAQIRNLPWPDQAECAPLPHPIQRIDRPGREEWLSRVSASLDAIEAHEIQKVVLARRSTFRFDSPLNPVDLMERLHSETPNRFHYFVEAQDGTAFLGATPERLVRREDNFVFSEAVAGTRPAVENEADDAALLAALMASDKDQREHLCVRWAIEDILRPFCEDLAVDAHASEMRLSRGRHLVSRFNGILREGVGTWQLVRHLHPTPAVGGYPAPAAIRAIRKSENFDRGWYAGPVGWVGRTRAEFAVALRCALVHGEDLHLYSGAGVVSGSQPQAEWDEIEHKIIDFARVLGLAGVGTD